MLRTFSAAALLAGLAAGSAHASLVFQMDFNDAAGNQSLLDRGTTGVTGSFNGNAAYSTTVAPSNTGGYSAAFGGSNGDNVNFGDLDAVDGLTTLTITAWIRPTDATGSDRIISDRNTTDGFDFYYHSVDTDLEFVVDGSVENGGGAIGNGAWTFVAVTYDGSITSNNVTFYTGNGTTLSTGDVESRDKGQLAGNTASLIIGNRGDNARPFEGLIDNVRIYSSVQDAASLTSIMQFNDVPEPSSLALLAAGGLLVAKRRRRSA